MYIVKHFFNFLRSIIVFTLLSMLTLELLLRATGGLINWYFVYSSNLKNKPPNNTVILAVGESTTFGLGASAPSRTYPTYLEQILDQQGYKVKVINAGTPGMISTGILRNIDNLLIQHHPDIVLLQLGANDFTPALNGIDANIQVTILKQFINSLRITKLYLLTKDAISNKQYSLKYGTFWDASASKQFHKNDPDTIILLQHNLDLIIDQIHKYQAKAVIVGYPQDSYFSHMLKEYAQTHQIDYIDTFILEADHIQQYTMELDEFPQAYSYDTKVLGMFSDDKWHLNGQGYYYMAEKIADTLIGDQYLILPNTNDLPSKL